MKTIRQILSVLLVILCFGCGYCHAQAIDGPRYAILKEKSESHRKHLDSLLAAQGAQTAAHIYAKEQIDETYSFQKQFAEYLDSIHDILAVAAEIYGVYSEVSHISKHLVMLKEVAAAKPTNPIAVLFDRNSHRIYTRIVTTGINTLNDIRDACFKRNKMSMSERIKMASRIRPGLHALDQQLTELIRDIYYTSLYDLWNSAVSSAVVAKADAKQRAILRARLNHRNAMIRASHPIIIL